MKASLICNYCDYKFITYDNLWGTSPKCPICKDTSIREVKVFDGNKNVFGYPEDGQVEAEDYYFPNSD